jgi:TPR repeat protein
MRHFAASKVHSALLTMFFLFPIRVVEAVDLNETMRLAATGDAWYQTELALMYHQGKKLPKDYAEALRWYRLAAEQDFSKAQANLGVMYGEGQGVTRDYTLAAEWFLKAAEKGNTLAQHNLGLLYGRGQGVKQDYAEAFVWESLAATSGHEDAIKNRDALKTRLSDKELAAAQRRESFLYLKIENRKASQ